MFAKTFELSEDDRFEVLVLHKELSFLLSQGGSELVLILTLLVGIAIVRSSACLLVEVRGGDLITTELHAETRADLTERHSLHLNSRFVDVVTLQVSELDRVILTTGGEDHHSLELLNVSFFQVTLVEEIDQKTLHSLMLIA